jgi:hypothetical protein
MPAPRNVCSVSPLDPTALSAPAARPPNPIANIAARYGNQASIPSNVQWIERLTTHYFRGMRYTPKDTHPPLDAHLETVANRRRRERAFNVGIAAREDGRADPGSKCNVLTHAAPALPLPGPRRD